MKWDWRSNRRILLEIEKEQKTMFEALEEKVTKLTSASDSATALLADIKARLDAIIEGGGLSPEAKAKLEELTAAIDKEADDLAAAVVANTPSEPPA